MCSCEASLHNSFLTIVGLLSFLTTPATPGAGVRVGSGRVRGSVGDRSGGE